MKPEELMLGDIIKTPKGIRKIEELSQHNYLLDWEDYGCTVEEVEPVSITPEILEKNGFTTDDYDIYIWEKGINKVRLYTDDNYTWFLDLRSDKCDDIDCLAINSIHELQHALRLCKIDKEVVL